MRYQCLITSRTYNTTLALASHPRLGTSDSPQKRSDCQPDSIVGKRYGKFQRSTPRNRGRDTRVPGGSPVDAQRMLFDMQRAVSFCKAHNSPTALRGWSNKSIQSCKSSTAQHVIGGSPMWSVSVHSETHNQGGSGVYTRESPATPPAISNVRAVDLHHTPPV